MSGHNRRDFLKNVALGASLLAPFSLGAQSLSPRKSTSANEYPFYGKHQQGIQTPGQRHICFVVLDLHTKSRSDIVNVFKTWTEYSRNLTSGQNVGAYVDNNLLPTLDTGEADSLSANNLTLTFGVGSSFFDKLDMKSVRPENLKDLPHFPRDQLQEEFTGGDICIQSCADDPQVAFHAIRNLVRVASSEISMKWLQMGFNSYEGKDTPRNLFGFKDGTVNPSTQKDFDNTVWIKDKSWLNGGSYLIIRRVKMFLETWDRTHIKGQNETFGRKRDSGAAFGKKEEFEDADINMRDKNGKRVMPEESHVFLAKGTGAKILRRSYSFVNGVDPLSGGYDAGLLFIAFQNDPMNFITIQNALGNMDKMNEYITHVGSGLFACFGGVSNKKNDYLGRALFS